LTIEYFWRCLIHFLESNSECDKYRKDNVKNKIIKSIDTLLKNGDCFELIDGDNLEFKGEFIKSVIETSKRDKVIVVCVIGPQSSGKSTLMNFAFGTQFFTSSGRCTKGIYFTL
jgi:polynucleotide 5'-kinase involved in rRNA processing